jgi:RNA polymerase sigma-70 factor, ECF subfamily
VYLQHGGPLARFPGQEELDEGERGLSMRDAAAFDDFYRDTSARMLRYGYAMTGDRSDAQDVVQEAYTRAWRHWRTVAEHPAPEAWVRLTVTRLATDRWRRLSSRRAAMIRSGPPRDADPPGETTVLLTAALRKLPIHLRQAIVLHYLLDMSVQEIAVETGSPVGTVTSWLRRGRLELATILPGPTLQEVNDVE